MTKPNSNIGVVYLLHFSEKLAGRSQHYIGWAKTGNLEKRLKVHRQATGGAKIVKHALLHGFEVCPVRLWHGVDRHFERRLKNRKNAKLLCPICKEKLF